MRKLTLRELKQFGHNLRASTWPNKTANWGEGHSSTGTMNREPWHMIFTDTITHFSFLSNFSSSKIKMRLTITIIWVFLGGSDSKECSSNAGDPGLIPGLGSFPGEGNGNPLQYLAWRIPWTEEPGGLQSMGS